MKALGKITAITKPVLGNGYLVTVKIDNLPEGLDGKVLDISMTEHKNRRSNDANALMWSCIGEIAHAVQKDPYEVYLDKLKQYGQYCYISVPAVAVGQMMRSWRLCEVVERTDDGTVKMLCFFGSSTYTTKEMYQLIEGILLDMSDMGLQRPPSSDIKRALDEYERRQSWKASSKKEKNV